MLISIPVSLGELVDKITILQIKARHLRGEALGHVQQELALLQQALQSTGVALDPALEAQGDPVEPLIEALAAMGYGAQRRPLDAEGPLPLAAPTERYLRKRPEPKTASVVILGSRQAQLAQSSSACLSTSLTASSWRSGG